MEKDSNNDQECPFEKDQVAQMYRELDRQLSRSDISHRPGFGGGKVAYIEGWKVIQLANGIFGPDGWSTTIMDITVDLLEEPSPGRVNCGVCAHIRVTLKNGSFHEDVGYGSVENLKSKVQALEKSRKEAVTDGVKRALRFFGNQLGNCLYDKAFVSGKSTNTANGPKAASTAGNMLLKPKSTYVPPNLNLMGTSGSGQLPILQTNQSINTNAQPNQANTINARPKHQASNPPQSNQQFNIKSQAKQTNHFNQNQVHNQTSGYNLNQKQNHTDVFNSNQNQREDQQPTITSNGTSNQTLTNNYLPQPNIFSTSIYNTKQPIFSNQSNPTLNGQSYSNSMPQTSATIFKSNPNLSEAKMESLNIPQAYNLGSGSVTGNLKSEVGQTNEIQREESFSCYDNIDELLNEQGPSHLNPVPSTSAQGDKSDLDRSDSNLKRMRMN